MDGLTARFTGTDRLLVQALMSGTSGAPRALCVFEKQHRFDLKLSLNTFLEMLCQNAISPENLSEPILP